MTREAFEAFISAPPFEMPIERFDDRSAWPGSYTELEVDLAWQAWKAATASERERAAVACEAIENERWALYKGRPPYTRTEPGRADNYVQGESGGAGSCASAIRALKESKE